MAAADTEPWARLPSPPEERVIRLEEEKRAFSGEGTCKFTTFTFFKNYFTTKKYSCTTCENGNRKPKAKCGGGYRDEQEGTGREVNGISLQAVSPIFNALY